MAHIGMKNPVAAKWAEGNKYTEGFRCCESNQLYWNTE